MFLLLVITLLFTFSTKAQDIIPPETPLVAPVISEITNNGPKNIGDPIQFTATCDLPDTQLIICRENTICTPATPPTDLICISSISNNSVKTCIYTPTDTDIGSHSNDIGTCCTTDSLCSTTLFANSWTINQPASPIMIVDTTNTAIPSTITHTENTTTFQLSNQPITTLTFTDLQGTPIHLQPLSSETIALQNATALIGYSINFQDITFTTAQLTALAQGTLLYQCPLFDFSLSICLGSWEFVKPLTLGETYTLDLAADTFAFAEAALPTAETPQPQESIMTVTNNGPVGEGSLITFTGSCADQDSYFIICKNNAICTDQTPLEDILCTTPLNDTSIDSCPFLTTPTDIGTHDTDVATCCTSSSCDTSTVRIDPWTVTSEVLQDNTTTLPTDTDTETIIQTTAEIHKPVKWIKEVHFTTDKENFTITIPKNATFDKIKKIKGGVKEDIPEDQWTLNADAIDQLVEVYDTVKNIEVEYFTEAPTVTEEQFSTRHKRIVITSLTHYTNIHAYTTIPESKQSNIHLFWIINDSQQEITNLIYADTNNNNLIDSIEWNVPSLSNQTYEILITKADHLDENRTFITDIYDQVKEQDGIWSETISENHYVRVVFEQALTAANDITIYPRVVQGNPIINVYESDGNQIIASFQTLNSYTYNKILLTNLPGSQDTFDLQVTGGSVEFDHIIDPIVPIVDFNDPCNNLNNWASTGTWVASVKCDARNTGGKGVNLTLINPINLSDTNITYANLSFTMANVGLDTGEYLRVLANSSVTPYVVLLETASNTAELVQINLSAFITLDALVHIRFSCLNSANSENCTIDDINVTSFQQGANTNPNNPSEVILNSTDQANTNYTFEDLSAGFLCDDPDASDTLTYDLDFIVDGVVNFSSSGISCADPEYVTVTLDRGNTTKGENWSFSVNVTDVAEERSSTVFSNNVTILNADPVVVYVSNVSGQSITEANVTPVEFSFNATDADGADDLDDTTAQGMFNLTGEETRMNQSCGQTASLNDTKEYNCTIEIQWYDAAGDWSINGSVQDLSAVLAKNDSTSFPLFQTTAIVLGPSSLTWPALTVASNNVLSDSDPIIINNTANKDITSGSVTVTALDLQGATFSTEFLRAANFTVNTADACNSGTFMINGTATAVAGSSVAAGNFTIGDGTGQEEIYFCIENVTADISPQDYSTSGPDSAVWTIEVS